jgi:hypothetical protein
MLCQDLANSLCNVSRERVAVDVANLSLLDAGRKGSFQHGTHREDLLSI